MERCLNHSMEVWGRSSRSYIVSVKDDIPTCTCFDYAIHHKRALSKDPNVRPSVSWCRHLTGQFDRLCRWRGEPLIPGLCDRCSGPTEVLTDDGDEQ